MLHRPKRLFVGRALRSDRLGETLLPKRLALPVFCSDPLSSVAYATEQIVLVLGLGGLGLLYLTPWLGMAVHGTCSPRPAAATASSRDVVARVPGARSAS